METRRARHQHDHYETPLWVPQRALTLLQCQPGNILDVGAGRGVWGKACRERWPSSPLTGIDIQSFPQPEWYDKWWEGDYLHRSITPGWELIIGNPPFRDAERFVRRSMRLLSHHGHLLFLLRLAFRESRSRSEGLFRDYPPKEVAVIPERIRFYGKGSGMTAMAFFLWQQGYKGDTRLTSALGENK